MAVDVEKAIVEIQKVISEDPTIREANRILVNVEKRGLFGLGGEFVTLTGSVHSDNERAKAGQIASFHAGGRKVVNQIQVVR